MAKKKTGWKWIAKDGHKLRRGTRRIIPASYCDTKTCKFYGKLAAQGVCYSRIDTGWEKIWNAQQKSANEHLKNVKAIWKKGKNPTLKSYISTLEGYYLCAWMNYSNCLDEVVALRRDNAKLRLAAGKWGKRGR